MPESPGCKDWIMDHFSPIFTQTHRVLEQREDLFKMGAIMLSPVQEMDLQSLLLSGGSAFPPASLSAVSGSDSMWMTVSSIASGFCNLAASRFAQLSQVTNQSRRPDTSSIHSFTPPPRTSVHLPPIRLKYTSNLS